MFLFNKNYNLFLIIKEMSNRNNPIAPHSTYITQFKALNNINQNIILLFIKKNGITYKPLWVGDWEFHASSHHTFHMDAWMQCPISHPLYAQSKHSTIHRIALHLSLMRKRRKIQIKSIWSYIRYPSSKWHTRAKGVMCGCVCFLPRKIEVNEKCVCNGTYTCRWV